MAVPSLPTNLASGAVLTETWVDASRAMHAWQRDDRPIFKGYCWDGDTSPVNEIATATNTTLGPGNVGSFVSVGGMPTNPVINVGGWTVKGADANPESLVVPEAGIYWLGGHVVWPANATGLRGLSFAIDGATDVTAGGTTGQGSGGGSSHTVISGVFDLAASTELDLVVYQDSGSALILTDAWISAIWMQST